MRSVSIAIWTSGEPVSVSCLPNDFVAFCFASLVRAMRLLRFESPSSQQTPRKEDAHGRDEVRSEGSTRFVLGLRGCWGAAATQNLSQPPTETPSTAIT